MPLCCILNFPLTHIGNKTKQTSASARCYIPHVFIIYYFFWTYMYKKSYFSNKTTVLAPKICQTKSPAVIHKIIPIKIHRHFLSWISPID